MKTFFKTYNLIFLLVTFIGFNAQDFNAQISSSDSSNSKVNPLLGLKKAGPEDQPNTPVMLDPMSIPMYDEQLQKINPEDFMKMMMSNEFVPEPYIDKNKALKAIVLRKATEDEKAMMLKMHSGMGMEMKQEKSVLIGNPAMDFNLVDLKGEKYKLSELKGKVIALNFWFVECKPCVMEMPELNELVEEFKGKEVLFLSIAINKKDQLKKFLKSTEFNYEVIPNGQTTADSFAVKGFPTNVIIDKNGIIQYVSTGIGPNNKDNLQKEINSLINR
jgi:peroxiredoxin